MKLDNTMRTAETQRIYQEAMANGLSRDIATVQGGRIGGLKIITDAYPPDIALKDVDIFVGDVSKEWEAYIKFGVLFFEGKLPHDIFLLNNARKQSQPHVFHIKGAYFKPRSDYKL